MTLYEFILLDKSQQYEVTFQKGEFVDAHIETNKRFALYAVDMFFVELEYDVRSNKIVNLVSFLEGEKLNRYSKLF